jgi:hypothetical protein
LNSKLLFLDFDGVLHPTSASEDERFSRVHLLDAIWPNDGCGIVISSSWRNFFPFTALVAHFPPAMRGCVIGITGPPYVGRWPRYQEIKAYLSRHGPLAEWRALDDAWFEFPAKCPELILCDPNLGIQEPQLQLLGAWLKS